MPDLNVETWPLMVPGARAAGVREVNNPFDGSLLARVECVDWDGASRAIETAHRLYRDREAWLPKQERIRVLEETAARMGKEAESLALLIAREGGKPLVDARVEVNRAIEGMRWCAQALRAQAGEMIPMNLNAASAQRLAFTWHELIGVVLAFSAFNHPLNLIVHQVGPAIAAGCPVIVKPAEATPLSCLRLVRLLRASGLPDAWCQPLVVNDIEVAGRMVEDRRIGFFSFIGSARVGWRLRARLAPGVRCALEHGGAAPVVVRSDADIEQAVPLIAKGGFYHAGQVCVSVQRVFAHHAIAEALAGRLAEAARNLHVGDPTLEATDVGPLIRPAEVRRVQDWVREAVDRGGRLLAGGEALSETCHACTVLFDPPGDARLSTHEVFGPVIGVYPYRDESEAVQRANALGMAFQAAVFTRDLDAALALGRGLDAAAVMINDHTAFRVDWMPFAGHKTSGLGTGGIPYAMREMQAEKLVVIRSEAL